MRAALAQHARATARRGRARARAAAAMAGAPAAPSRRCRARPASGAGPAAGGGWRRRRRGMRAILAACRGDASGRVHRTPGNSAPASLRYPVAMRTDPIERLLRGLYSAALYLLVPVTVYHLIWRGFRQREYFQRWNERYAVYRRRTPHARARSGCTRSRWARSTPPRRWSTRCARPHPDLQLLVTTITPTGSARVRALWGDAVEHVYLPYDLPGAVARFLAHFRPRAGADHGNRVVAEPAVRLPRPRHPDLHPQRAPVGALAARLPRAGAAGRRARCARCARVLRAVARRCASASCASARAPRRWSRPATSSSTSPCPTALPAFVAQFRAHAGARPVWIAASTHEDEEAAVIAIHRRLRARWPGPAAAVGAAPSGALPRRWRPGRATPAGASPTRRADALAAAATTRCS